MRETRSLSIVLSDYGGRGPERAMTNLANGLHGHDCVVELVYFGRAAVWDTDAHADIPRIHLAKHRRGLITILRNLLPMMRYIRTRKPEVVLTTDAITSIVSILATGFAGTDTRAFVRIANTYSIERGSRMREWVEKFLYRNSRCRFIAVSHGSAADFRKSMGINGARVDVVYTPVDLTRVVEKSLEPVDAPWFNDRSVPVLLSVGMMAKAKQFDMLIRAFRITHQRRQCRLVIVGDGPLRSELEALVAELGLSDCVWMPGFDPNPYRYMGRAALCVLSSKTEGLPTVLIESLAVGCPVVATDCPNGPREILEDGKWGELVPVGDETALADAICRTLDNPMPRRFLKERASYFSLETGAGAYYKVFYGSSRTPSASQDTGLR